jgi:hypothetical protein
MLAATGVYRLGGRRNLIRATLDYYDDPLDVYAIYAGRGEQIVATVSGQAADGAVLAIFPAATEHGRAFSSRHLTGRALANAGPALTISLTYHARRPGWYYLALRAVRESPGGYRLLAWHSGDSRADVAAWAPWLNPSAAVRPS